MRVGAERVAELRPAVLPGLLIRPGQGPHLQVHRLEDGILGLDVDDALLLPGDAVQPVRRVGLVIDVHGRDLVGLEVFHGGHRVQAEDQRSVHVGTAHLLPGDEDLPILHFHARELFQQVDGIIASLQGHGGRVIH